MNLITRAYRKLNPLPQVPFTKSGAYQGRVELYKSLPVTDRVVLVGDSIIDFAPWDELLGDVVNRGIAGDTAEGVMRRLPAVLNQNPRQVFVLCGVNDLLQGKSADRVVSLFRGVNRSVYLISILPTHNVELNRRISHVNAALSTLTDHYVDCYSRFVNDQTVKPELTSDGIHLSCEGYLLLASHLRQLIT